MVTVHIHGLEQCTEVRANTVEDAIHTYIRHNAWWLGDWQGTTVQYEQDNVTIREIIANFRTEICRITRIAGTTQVFYAKWEDT